MNTAELKTFNVEYKGKDLPASLAAMAGLGMNLFTTTIKGSNEDHARRNFEKFYPCAEIVSMQEETTTQTALKLA